MLLLLLLCWGWTYQLLNISVVVSSQPSSQQHRDYLELARPALFFSHPMALGGHQDQNEYSCKSPAAALLYSNGYSWGCCYGCRKRVEIQVQKSLLLTATFLIMERAAQRHHGLQCRTEKDWSERDTHNGFDAHYRIVIFFPSAEKC